MRTAKLNTMFAILATFLFVAGIVLINSTISYGEEVTGTVTASVLNVRTGPGTNYTVAGKLNQGTTVTILEDMGNGWYKIAYIVAEVTYEGYVSQTYISVNVTTPDAPATPEPQPTVDFEAELAAQNFPESYKTYLRTLHAKYPNWKFVAIHTNLDWNTVVANETNVQGSIKNTVQGTSSAPHYNWRSTDVGYNWATDKWSVYDGTNWYAASKDLIAYYLDPRNCLDENYIFEFESLNYVEGGQNATGVEALLAGSFMANALATGSDKTYSQIMMEAGLASGVSPYHIASRIKQEVGNVQGTATSGTNETYPGIYNFYNIGAYDSATGDAAVSGLKWAATEGSYGRPWDSPAKSITGGASYIGNGYINKGQNTLYFEKFNVVNTTSGLYKHQYQTNVQAPTVEGYRVAKAYTTAGMKGGTITFNIPVYLNMPENRCAKPADSGNPNNWLKTLAVTGYTLTPTFSVSDVTDYQLIVGADVASVEVTASSVNGRASISGIGTIPLQAGTNTLSIAVTAQNGSVRTYTLTIVRGAEGDGQTTVTPPESADQTISLDGKYTVTDSVCTGVAPDTKVATFTKNLGAADATVAIYKEDGKTVQTGKVGTGNKIVITKGDASMAFTVVIYGDLNGDGKITALDLLRLQKHILGASKLEGTALQAANIKRSGDKITALDLLRLQKHIIGASKIKQ